MKVLFYSLNAALWLHALPENRMVRELKAVGHDVTYVTCGSCFPQHCTSMSASGIELGDAQEKKEAICTLCTRNANILARSNKADHLKLRDFLNDDDHETSRRLVETLSVDTYLDFQYMGINVGRLASYELFLKYKKMSPKLAPEQWAYCKLYIKNCLISLLGFSRLFRAKNPDVVFFYSPQYGINGVCAQFAENEGSTAYFVEGSSSNAERYRALRLWRWSVHGLVNPALDYWSESETLSIEEIARLRGHFRELVSGKSFAVYSAPMAGKAVSMRAKLRIPEGAKVLLMTLSSFDEAYAAHMIGRFPDSKVMSSVFKDQFEWVKSTVEYLSGRSDVFVVVRVHPRDFPNKREATQSEQASVWTKLFVDAPDNVRVNWPEDQLSLYDIFREVDVVLTGWSATGVEALALGIPVITYDARLPSYPREIHFSGLSRAEYFTNIEQGLASGWQFSHAENAFRWLGLSFSRGTLQITPPVQIERFFRFLLFRRLRAMAVGVFGDLIKWIDAHRKFGPVGEAKRFRKLVEDRDPNVFRGGAIARSQFLDERAVRRAIETEHVKFASAVGLRTAVTDAKQR